MVIAIEELRLAYAAVPKAGCTSAKMMLAQIDPACEQERTEDQPALWMHRRYQTQRFKPRLWRPFYGGYCFTVIRDPLARLLSVFTNRVLEKGDLRKSRRMKSGQTALPFDPDPDFFFQHLDAYRAASSSIRHHTIPTQSFTGANLNRFSRVYTTSELSDLARDLSEIADRDVVVPHANRSKTKLKLDDLRPETRQAIAAYLDEEYLFLSNRFNNPFA